MRAAPTPETPPARVDDAPDGADHRGVRLDDLARKLSDRTRIGLTPDLCAELGVRTEDATRGLLLAQEDDEHGHLGVYLLGAYVVDDTDLWGDGEIYWWSIPVLVDKAGKATTSPLAGLPTGMPPHKCGSLEWMTNLSLADPPLLAVLPPDDELAACVLRLAVYDDDREPANLPLALSAGLEALAGLPRVLPSADQVIAPVRDAIFAALKAGDDDILIDGNITLRRGQASRFGAGLVGSEINAMVRAYYLVRDERRTEQAGPFQLLRGQVETVRFPSQPKAGGRLAVFARGAEVNTTAFGTLTTEQPFVNRVLDAAQAAALASGFNLNGTGPAKVVAFYTPP